MKPYYYIHCLKNVNDCWYWRLMSSNGNILSHSEAYSSKNKMLQTVKNICKEFRVAYTFLSDPEKPVKALLEEKDT